MMAVLAGNVSPHRSDVSPTYGTCVVATTPADRLGTTRRLRLCIPNERGQLRVRPEADEHVHVIHQHRLVEDAHVVTFGGAQDRLCNDLDVALGDSPLTPPCPPGDVRVELERLVPMMFLRHSHSGSYQPRGHAAGFKEWEACPRPQHSPNTIPGPCRTNPRSSSSVRAPSTFAAPVWVAATSASTCCGSSVMRLHSVNCSPLRSSGGTRGAGVESARPSSRIPAARPSSSRTSAAQSAGFAPC